MSEYGAQLNWEDSFGPASKHLGVSEEQWQAFIAGVNDIKARAQAWTDQGGNQARVMQDRSTPDAVRDRRVAVLLSQNPDMTPEEAIAQVEASSGYQDLSSNIQAYDELNAELNDLYASVGLDPTGALQGSGTNAPGYAVNFDFNSGEVSHSKGDVVHDVGKAVVAGIGGGMLGTGVAGALKLTGTLSGAVKGAVGSAASQGMLTGKIDAGDVLTAGLTGGAMGAFSDYLADSANMFPDSDLGGMLGDGGFLNKLGFDTEYLSTSAGINALDAMANNPIVSGAQKILAPLFNSDLGQKGLDALTSAMMNGYNDEWEEKVEFDQNGNRVGLNSSATKEDWQNYYRWEAAQDAGENAFAAGNSLDGSPIWRLDERYPWTTTPRDPDSNLVGILDTPLEEGGKVDQPAFIAEAEEEIESEENSEGGKAGAGAGDKDGDGKGEDEVNADDLDDGKDDVKDTGVIEDIASGGFAQDNTIDGNQAGNGVGIIDDTTLPISDDDSQVVINQIIEAINLETDPDVKSALEEELANYVNGISGDSELPVDDGGDTTLPISDGNTTLPPASDEKLPPASDQDLPPSDDQGGSTVGSGLLLSLAGSNGLPPLWTDLDPYTKFRTYKSERTKLIEGMLSSIAAQELKRAGQFVPKTPSEKELFEAGMLT